MILRPDEKASTIRRYEERLEKHGISPRAMGWRDREQQYMRFLILTEIGDVTNRAVLDVGCGFGDLCEFLKSRNLAVKYTGYDISKKLVDIAKGRHPEATFRVVDISEETVNATFDYVFSSGIFNASMSANEDFMETMVARCFDLCTIGVAVNMMSKYVDYEDETLYYYSPEKVLAFCKTLTKRVTLRHDYMPYEFTVYLYKNDEVNERNVFVQASTELNGFNLSVSCGQ